MEKIRLLSLNFKGSISHCTFSSLPSDEFNFMILLSASELPLIIFLQLGNNQWTELNYEKELEKCLKDSGDLVQHDDDRTERYYPLRIISCNGNLYAQTFTSSLLLIEKLKPDGVVIRSVRLRFPTGPHCVECVSGFLVEFQGQIYVILFGFGGIDYNEAVAVDIHRLDQSEIIFEKVLGHVPDLVFFVDEHGSLLLPGNRARNPWESHIFLFESKFVLKQRWR